MRNRSKYLILLRENIKISGAVILSLIFLIVSTISIRAGGTILWLIPPALIMVLIAFYSIDKFLLLTVFLVPLSIQLRFIIPGFPADIFLPTELMLAGILILMVFKVFITGEINRKIIVHPVSIASFLMLGWYLITSLTSTMPGISLKSFIARLWFFAGFYLLAAEIFRKPGRIRSYFLAYITGMIPVVIYYLVRMWQAGIVNQKAAYTAIRPFFNDHTSFGASLAFCIPVIIFLLTDREISRLLRVVLSVVLLAFSAAFLFSYSRAAWISLAAAALVAAIMILKISWKVILPAAVISLLILAMLWSGFMIRLNENRQESSGDLKNHLQSIANIRSDASNMERINRWKSALRMSVEKPVFGWGPATYQFSYAPFQIASEKTIISTNYGEGGNAHSEYLGSLVDSGIPGLILYIVVLLIPVGKGIKIYRTSSNKQVRKIVLALIAGLVTYIIHGALNNFLDTDKISALFWGMIAAVVAIDTWLQEEKEERDFTGGRLL